MRSDPSRLLPEYLYGFLRSPAFKAQVEQLRSGVAQPQLPIRDIKKIEIPIPHLVEQQSIVNNFGAYDDLIENNRRRMALLEESARQLYREWFVRLRFPGHEHTRINDGVPEGWEAGCVADFFDTGSGGTPSRKNPDFFTGDIPWVKTQELQNCFITDTDEKITDDALKQSTAKLYPNRTVLVAMYGATIGQIGILASEASCNQACCAVVPRDGSASYIYAFLFFLESKPKLVSLGMGAAQNNINQQIVRSFPMILPPQGLLNAFNGTLEPVFQQLLYLERQNKKLRAARDLLLPRLMSGEIAV